MLETATEQRAIFRQAGLVFRPHPERACGKLRRAKGTTQENPQSVGVGSRLWKVFLAPEEKEAQAASSVNSGWAKDAHGSKPMAFLKMSEAGHSEHERTERRMALDVSAGDSGACEAALGCIVVLAAAGLQNDNPEPGAGMAKVGGHERGLGGGQERGRAEAVAPPRRRNR